MNFFSKISIIFKDALIRKRVLFTVGALIVFRLLAAIPMPGLDASGLQHLLSSNQFFGLLNIFSGGGISNLSIVMLGVGPFITASIIIQLLTMMLPNMKAMLQEDGEAGRLKLSQYSRYLSVPLALLQAFGFLILLKNQGVIPQLPLFQEILSVIVISGGSVLLMWLGEIVSEFGIGNGVSLIIFAGIVAAMPKKFLQLLAGFDASQLPLYILAAAVALVVVAAVVFITEAERPVPVTYAKQVRGNKVYGGVSTYIPLRLNQAGVIPIIFAISILLFPQIIANFLATSTNATLSTISAWVVAFLSNQWAYGIAYFVLVFLFAYFYTAVTFDPQQISENLQKSGAFVPGVRPGEPTASYLGKVVTRITLVGAVFLGIIAVLPVIMRGVTGVTSLSVGGTALLIVVSVVLDLLKRIEAQATMREY